MSGSTAARLSKQCPTCGVRYAQDAVFCPADGTPLAREDAREASEQDSYLGREISGHIEIRALAGSGAMGRVYRAFQRGIDRDVAVKVLHRELSANAQLVRRFHHEAKVASRLQHPNVVQVHLAGQLPDGALYIVMEYLDGVSLQGALAEAGGSMPLLRALRIALQLCDAVGEAHAQGVVHRDLKPENVMLVRRGENPDTVKVLDFGIARFNWGEQSMATAAGLIFGTTRYISPEGAQGQVVGPPGDVYGIATILYQMLTGRTPFEGDDAVGLLLQQIHQPPPHMHVHAPAANVPDPIAELVMANLAKSPAMRAETARVLGRQLFEAARASGLSVDDLVSQGTLAAATAEYEPTPTPGSVRVAPRGVNAALDDGAAIGADRASIAQPVMAIAPVAPSPERPAIPTPLPQVLDRTVRGRRAAGFVVLALVGLVVAGVWAAYDTGRLDRIYHNPIDDSIMRSRAALHMKHWEEPAHDNVRDLTSEALEKWPKDPRTHELFEIRELACDEVVKDAVGQKLGGHLEQALHLAELAHELDPTDTTAERLISEYEGEFAHEAPAATAPHVVRAPPASPAAANGVHATLSATPQKPRVGQQVDLSVDITLKHGRAPKGTAEAPAFQIIGPDGAAALLPALTDSAAHYHANFAFVAPGAYQVVFSAKIDGNPVKAQRLVEIAEAPRPAEPVLPPAPSGKWL